MRAHITLDHTLDLAALTCESIPASARMLAAMLAFRLDRSRPGRCQSAGQPNHPRFRDR
jgi:hypothetical protein